MPSNLIKSLFYTFWCFVIASGCSTGPVALQNDITYRIAYREAEPSHPNPLINANRSLVDKIGRFHSRIVQKDNLIKHEHWVHFNKKNCDSMSHISAAETNYCHFGLTDTNTESDAWDNAYLLIAKHNLCPQSNILGLNKNNERELMVIEPNIPHELSDEEVDFISERRDAAQTAEEQSPVTNTINDPIVESSRSWPFPEIDSDPQKNETDAEFWHRRHQLPGSADNADDRYSGLDEALNVLRSNPNLKSKQFADRVVIAHFRGLLGIYNGI